MSFVVLITILYFPDLADAAVHHLPLFHVFDDPKQKICFTGGFDRVNLDGFVNQAEKIQREIRASIEHMSSATNMDIEIVSIIDCDDGSQILGDEIDTPYYWATTSFVHEDGELYKVIRFSTAAAHRFSVAGTCAPGETTQNIRYVANHEMGHFAGLGHPEEGKTPLPGETMMDPDCNPDYGSIQQGDIAQINSLYPIIPPWIRNNAGWWVSGHIDDIAFAASLKYVIAEEIVKVRLPETYTGTATSIPAWVKSNADLWHKGKISDRTFGDGITYLVQIGVVRIGASPADANVFAADAGAGASDPPHPAAPVSATTITPKADSSPRCEPDCFTPSVLRVAAGTTVTFSNTDDAVHTFTHGNPHEGLGGTWDSRLVWPGQAYSVTLSKAGTYRYFSMTDPWMQGSILVGSSSATANGPPTADAGADRTVDERATVVLSGSGTDPEDRALRYSWNQISGPSVLLSHSNYPGATSQSQNSSFTAPEAPASPNVSLQFRLTVKDDALQRATDTVTVTVRNTDAIPNRAPTASAGADQSVLEGAAVTLDGSGSSDPDAGDALSYAWTQLRGPDVALSSGSAQSPTFTAPEVRAGSVQLQFKLVVRDSSGAPGHPDYASVTVSDVPAPASNRAPVARPDVAQASGTDPATIDVLFNDSDPDGDALSISSVDASGASGAVSIKADKSDLTFTASAGFSGTTTFTYVASDARGALSPPARVTVDVARPPSADGALWARAHVPPGGGIQQHLWELAGRASQRQRAGRRPGPRRGRPACRVLRLVRVHAGQDRAGGLWLLGRGARHR